LAQELLSSFNIKGGIMKHLIVLFVLGFSLSALGELTYSGQLSEEDQKYYKNDSGAGMNNLERINSTVKEINKNIK